MMSWQPRTVERNWLIAGPRVFSARVVRMWNDSGSPSSMAASQNGS